jgi:hypothetical protein
VDRLISAWFRVLSALQAKYSSRAHQTWNRAAPLARSHYGGSRLKKLCGTIAPWRSWGPGQTSFLNLRHAAQGKDFGGLTRRSQEPRGVRLQGSDRSNSSMSLGAASTTIRRLALYVIMFIELCSNSMSLFAYFFFSCGQLLFPCLTSSLSCAILSQAGLLEVHATYLGSFDYFLAQGPMLLNDCFSEKLMLTGGPECTTCLGWFCTISMCTLPP